AKNILLMMLGWIFSLALVIVPYVLLVTYLSPLPEWAPWVYGVAVFTYVGMAATVTPTFDTDEMGLLGGLIDNPFTLEDDFNRWSMGLAVVLMPGKIVVGTLAMTWQAVRG